MIYIGIDPGTKTGLAVWDSRLKKFLRVETTTILQAFAIVKGFGRDEIRIFIEDARQVKYKTSPEKAQGAGSVKRDCAIWEEFCTFEQLPCNFSRPNPRITKLPAYQFKRVTGWEGRTSSHARDAALLVFKR